MIQEPELCKEILNNKDRAYPKRESLYFVKKLLGDGLVTIVEHEKWAKLRRIATHAFHGESLKVSCFSQFTCNFLQSVLLWLIFVSVILQNVDLIIA